MLEIPITALHIILKWETSGKYLDGGVAVPSHAEAAASIEKPCRRGEAVIPGASSVR